MDSAITTAIITASTSVLTCFLGVKAGRTRLFSPYQKEYLEQQIFEFLAPIDRILTFHTEKDWNDIRPELMSLIEKKYALVPPLILSECVTPLTRGEITNEQFLKLQTITSSLYNWARREVGHSYDRAKIKREYTPVNEAVEKAAQLFVVFVVFATLFCAMFLWFLFVVPEEKFEQAKNWALIFLILVLLYLCWLLIMRIFKGK